MPTHIPRKDLTMTVLMTPDLANFAGNVHGGTILKLLDQVAYSTPVPPLDPVSVIGRKRFDAALERRGRGG
jgi:hypothetical protein